MKIPKRNFLLICICLLSTMVFAGPGPGSEVFQIRLAVPGISTAEPMPNAERMVLEQVRADGRAYRELFDVDRKVLLDQKDIKAAKVTRRGGSAKPIIDVTFTAEGGKRFAEVTRQNIDKRLAIILGGRICSAPVIRTEIPDGKAEITGGFSQKEAEELCRQINNALKN
jgi:preprotein translocase subunit SecD